MAQDKSFNDDATDRRLLLLIGLVVVSASIAVAVSAVFAAGHRGGMPSVVTLMTIVFAVTVANRTMARFRIRANRQGFSWTEVAVLVGLSVAPGPWVVLCVTVGITVSKAIARVGRRKLVFGVAKETLAAVAAGLVFVAFDAQFDGVRPQLHVEAVAVALVVMAVIDEILTIPVIALAARTPVRQVLRNNLDIQLVSFAAGFVVTVFTVQILALDGDSRLLLAVPPVVLSVHLWYASRLRARTERKAWQNLAASTDALNEVELKTVLHTAVARATELFSADEIEVEVWITGSRRLVRGTGDRIRYDGPPLEAPPDDTRVIAVPLEGYDGGDDVGVLRVRFRGSVSLSEREQYTLRTFASALCTAVRNASAYAELARIAAENAHAASHDPLTGLANRRALLDRGAEVLAEQPGEGVTALLLIDLNHFKEVNDTLGHAAGDRVLIEVARRLRAASHPDDLVARLGGDEFAVLFTALPAPAMAAHRATVLLGALQQAIGVDGMRITVEGCGGIAYAAGTGGVAELLRRADVAMYQAKRSGQRIVTYLHTRDTADVERLALGGDLPRAMAEQEFVVEFQPIVDLGSGEVVAAEALARWRHPDHGNLNPMRFLEAVERSGMLPAFADAVLDQSLQAAGVWRDEGFDIPVAVNVSPRSLLDPSFPRSVLSRLEAHNLPADRLFLELTETLTISQLEVVDQVLGELRDAGIRLALDDFGTGYSSLSVLSRIPVHELKIDREFVMAMDASAEATAVIRSTVDLGRNLNLVVVAEGVESEPQRRALWEMGCTAGQGHLFARPMPAPRLLAALRRGADDRPGTLAAPLHDAGAVIRLAPTRRAGRGRGERLPHLPA